jgi:glycine betaine/proline transport system ATP-binding protein
MDQMMRMEPGVKQNFSPEQGEQNIGKGPKVQTGAFPPVECRNLYKIYGKKTKDALNAIKNEGLSKAQVLARYGCVTGVIDASFSISQGEIFCIMGLSGSGKSTLIRQINCLIEPTEGQVLIDGQLINTLTPKKMRRLRSEKLGMVFQNMALLPRRNVRDNVAFGLELRRVDKKTRYQAAEKALELVQLSGWENKYPEELSGGMQQRVGLARALAVDPDILLMDEPFSALDPLIRRQLQKEFIKLSDLTRKTTLFITHDLDEAIRLGHRIAIMKDGVLVQIGTPEEIITNPTDDYVADFVAGISRLKLVYAHTVMKPIETYTPPHRDMRIEDLPKSHPEADLDSLIDIITEKNKPILVVEGNEPVGIVTKRSLLLGIQGKQDIGQ